MELNSKHSPKFSGGLICEVCGFYGVVPEDLGLLESDATSLDVSGHFEETSCLHLQGSVVSISNLERTYSELERQNSRLFVRSCKRNKTADNSSIMAVYNTLVGGVIMSNTNCKLYCDDKTRKIRVTNLKDATGYDPESVTLSFYHHNSFL
jgi:hypothetical protein